MELEVRLLQLYSRVLVDDPTNTSEHECLSPRSELRAAVLQWESPEGREQLLADAGHISTWEVSAVTNMSGLYQEMGLPEGSDVRLQVRVVRELFRHDSKQETGWTGLRPRFP